MRQPSAGNGWSVVATTGGWLRFHPGLGRCGAHCAAHAGCKMDRRLIVGCVGLSLAWLEAGRVCTRADHAALKETLTRDDKRETRAAQRAAFHGRAQNDASCGAILDRERELREGAATEPLTVPCPSTAREFLAALARESA